MSTYACTALSQDAWNGAWYGFGSSARDAGFTVNSTGKKTYYTTVIRFTTPSFSGESELVEIQYSAKEHFVKDGGDVTLRWALCVEDANGNCESYRDEYWGIGSAVAKHTYQIDSGEKTHGNGTSSYSDWSITISSTAIEPDTTYYLFLWAKNDSSGYSSLMTIAGPSNHSATVTVKDDLVWIRDGGSWKRARVWIRDGGTWKRALPWIRDGGTWKNTC